MILKLKNGQEVDIKVPVRMSITLKDGRSAILEYNQYHDEDGKFGKGKNVGTAAEKRAEKVDELLSGWINGDEDGFLAVEREVYDKKLGAFADEYAKTQKYFKDNNIKEVRVFRGVTGAQALMLAEAKDNGTIKKILLAPDYAHSWSDSLLVARTFAVRDGKRGWVIERKIPVAQVLTSHLSNNSLREGYIGGNEGEFIIMDRKPYMVAKENVY